MKPDIENTPPIQNIPSNKIFISWSDINQYITEIQKFLDRNNFIPEAILTVHKGGLIPATMLAYRLKTNDIYTIKVEGSQVVYSKDIVNLGRKSILIVDNIIERGEKLIETIKFLQNLNINNALIVSIIQKEADNPSIVPSFAPKKITKEEWAIFPWEELNY